MTMTFQGFTDETAQFLWGIRLNNERGWFLAHKEDYLTHAYNPLCALGGEVQERFLDANPDLALNLRVTRIYRDVRLVRDGRRYKDHLWFVLCPPQEGWTANATFYFEIAPEGYELGMGYYWAPPAMMALYRKKLLEERPRADALARGLLERPDFQLIGDEYKRPKGEVSDLLKPWFNRKAVSLCSPRSYDDGRCSGPGLVDDVVEGFQWLLPYYRFFRELDEAYQAQQ
ncbi:MAG: DUF2461 domain-containing protein [Clostridiales bacterium]|nr:DUF2461 domain-containing protein [Clostridiales bacterium]